MPAAASRPSNPYPRVTLRLEYPLWWAPPSGQKRKAAAADDAHAPPPPPVVSLVPPPKPPPTAAIWPSGGNWRPTTHDWGTRQPDAFGCGKCRWRPSGCRGCIEAAKTYSPKPAPPLRPGAVTVPSQREHGHVYAHDEAGLDEASRVAAARALVRHSVHPSAHRRVAAV